MDEPGKAGDEAGLDSIAVEENGSPSGASEKSPEETARLKRS